MEKKNIRMNKPMVTGYRHTGIIVKSMEESLYFYQDILGLEVIQDFSDNSDYINTIIGITDADIHMIKLKSRDGTVLELLEYRSHPTQLTNQKSYNAGVCHVAFQVENANETYKALKEKGVTIISKPILSSEKIAKVFFCLDPNEVRVELVEITDQ